MALVYTKNVLPRHKVGDHTYGFPKVLGDGELIIGKFCSFASDVVILLGVEHRTDWITTYPFPILWGLKRNGHPHSKGAIVIGNDVLIGYGATILSGVTIGDGAVIGARAVVSRDIPPYAVAVGNPARVAKLRFHKSIIEKLLDIRWWDLSDDQIQKLASALCDEPGIQFP